MDLDKLIIRRYFLYFLTKYNKNLYILFNIFLNYIPTLPKAPFAYLPGAFYKPYIHLSYINFENLWSFKVLRTLNFLILIIPIILSIRLIIFDSSIFLILALSTFIIVLAIFSLKFYIPIIFSSSVSLVINLYTLTTFLYPNLCALSMAWRSAC